MDKQIDCKEMRRNPELFKKELQNAVANIAESLSDNDWKEPRLTFQNSLNTLITDMWNQQDISNKLLALSQLEQASPPDTVAWRPTAGEVPLLTFRGNNLQERKSMLLNKLKSSREELEELNKTFTSKEHAMKKHIEKITKANEYMSNVTNTYEKIQEF